MSPCLIVFTRILGNHGIVAKTVFVTFQKHFSSVSQASTTDLVMKTSGIARIGYIVARAQVGQCTYSAAQCADALGGSGSMPPRKILEFRTSEITSAG